MNTRLMRMVLLASSLLMAGLVSAHSRDGMMGQQMGCGTTGQGMMGHDMMGSSMGPEMMGMDHGMMGSGMMGSGMMGSGMGIGRMMGVPNLTDQQRQDLIQRHRQLEKRMLDLEKQALDARFALEDAFSKSTPDPQAVGSAMQGMFDVRKQMVQAAIVAHNDMLGKLTDQQREALEQGHSRMGAMRGNAGGDSMHHGGMMQQPPR